ncbi:MAG: hypothetical protein GY856_32860 [bacterium]|nr:hypothetical protein [bacterium]
MFRKPMASGPYGFTTVGSMVFFEADDGVHGRELFAFDLEVLELVPEAAFTGTPMSGASPLTVEFVDQSTGLISDYAWDFGDGSTGC